MNNTPTGGWNNTEFGYKNYQSRLPEVYTGHPNRIERYNQYEMMDVDAEINACLDIIAENTIDEKIVKILRDKKDVSVETMRL